jgi:hypothetical protein
MDRQLLLTIVCVAVAAAYLAASIIVRVLHRGNCETGCGGCNKPTDTSMGLQVDITARLRARVR